MKKACTFFSVILEFLSLIFNLKNNIATAKIAREVITKVLYVNINEVTVLCVHKIISNI